jgi:hypothetical protein
MSVQPMDAETSETVAGVVRAQCLNGRLRGRSQHRQPHADSFPSRQRRAGHVNWPHLDHFRSGPRRSATSSEQYLNFEELSQSTALAFMTQSP